MERTEEINNKLYAKMEVEYEKFTKKLERMEPKDIIANAYEKVFKEDILMTLSENDLPYEQAKALMQIKDPLDECYQAWLKSDYSYMPDLRECIEGNAKSLSKLMKENTMER